jgi:hypothetical protein
MEQIDRVAIAPLKTRYGHRKFYTEYIPVLGIQIQKEGKKRIVIIRSVLLVLLDREKLPRLKQFKARGFEFRRVDERNNEEWLAKLVENYE